MADFPAITHTTLVSLFSDIASAIRAKKGMSAEIIADEFPSAIMSIPSGITPTGKITITENGTDIDVAQYALADVNVSGGGGTDYLQYATHLANAFEDAVFNIDDLVLNIPNNTTLSQTFFHDTKPMGVKNLTLNIGNGVLTTINECFRGNTSVLETITINGTFADTLAITFISGAFRACRVLKSINSTPLPKLAGSNTWMQCYALEEVRFKPNIQSSSCTFADCVALSDASLVSIANALIVGSATLTLNATPKGRLNSIMGNVVDGVFTADASGSTTLRDFITQIKGWTIA